ncbi:ferric reductase-like transmembrane domain-containing protein [Paracoccus nototheniae]|nr:ferric reductase-like transmembrane domain-containing protein [Paracoccus nototheniae]
MHGTGRIVLIWGAVGLAIAVPVVIAATSPLLAWRDPVYILAGLAGVIGLALLLLQPLLAARLLPGLSAMAAARVHRWIGTALVGAVVLHVAALWVTSPPDVVDALLFRSPTPFSVWGVIAMWAVFASGLLAVGQRRLRLRPRTWRRAHVAAAAVIVGGTVLHALLIQGTMGVISKTVLCLLVLAATLWVIAAPLRRR